MIDSALKEQVLANLVHRIDLRRVRYSELKGEQVRERVRNLVVDALSEATGNTPSEDSIHEIVSEAVGLGPLEQFFTDPQVTEIMVNGPNAIFIERNGVLTQTEARFTNIQSLRRTIDRIVTPLCRRVDEASPMVDARLPDGSRVNVILPPLSLGGPILTIRRFSTTPLDVARLIEMGSISKLAVRFLHEAVQLRRNILIAGGTGSGKTTLLNALSAFIPSGERIITIEDAAELKLHQSHVISLEARPPNIEGSGQVLIRDLLRNALRMRPDRIIIGECRGAETLDMLQAMNTGHDGSLTTVHANSPRDALFRIETMVLMAGFDLPLRAIREQLASALHLIIYQTRTRSGARQVTHIVEVAGADTGVVQLQELFHRDTNTGELIYLKRAPRFLQFLPECARNRFMGILHDE